MSDSVRKPSGPTAMLVGIPNKRCFAGDLDDFLEFFPNIEFIHVDVGGKGASEETKAIEQFIFTAHGTQDREP